MPAIKYLKTKVDTSKPWDSSKVEAALPADVDAETLREAFAWVDPQGDADKRNAYKFPHHFINEDGSVGPASSKACLSAIAYLNTSGSDAGLSDEDLQGIRNHLAAHLKEAKLDAPQLNGVPTEGTHHELFRIDKNSFEDDGNGTLTFPNGQTVSDGQVQRSGTQYEIDSMDLSEYNGSVTEDHDRSIRAIMAKTKLRKRGDDVVMDALQFAINENPIAQVDYDLYRNGYAKDFSIETYGPWPDENGLMVKAKVVGLSGVVVGNNRSATVNSLIAKSLATARKNGLDITEVEKTLGVNHAKDTEPEGGDETLINNKEDDMKFVTVENGRDFAIKVSYKNAAGNTIDQELAPGATLDVSDDQKEAFEKQISDAKNPEEGQPNVEAFTNALTTALEAQDKKNEERFTNLEKNLLDASGTEPEFKPSRNSSRTGNRPSGNKLADMDWKERTGLQIQALHASLKAGDFDAAKLAREINGINLEALQKAGIVDNSLDLPDLGNFVIPPEMITDIKEQASNYAPLLGAFQFEETLSLETAFLKGTSEIQMADVDMNDDDDDTDLKPISKPTFSTDNVQLKEFAAITPIKASAIRFAAVDLVGHLTKLYRRAYDRALSQSVIGRLEKAVESNGNTVAFDYHSASVDGLITLITAWGKVAEHTPNGVYLMTQTSYLSLLGLALKGGVNGPLSQIFTNGPDAVPYFLGRPYVVVPSDLMPNLETADTKSWTFEGTSVTVNSGVYYADPTDFVGKVSGGLNFQVSDVASYEESSTVKSAFQRDELVFRGYGYRASGLYFPGSVSAITAPGIS